MSKVRKVGVFSIRTDDVDDTGDYVEEQDEPVYLNNYHDPPYDAEEEDEEDEEDEDDYEQPSGLFSTPGRTIALIFSALLLLLLAGASAWLLGQRAHTDPIPTSVGNGVPTPEPNTAVKIGSHPPDFELINMYTGQPVKLSSFRGKPVWVNFWASWCAPCKAEMPEMKDRYAKLKDKGLVILGVDDMEDNATVSQYVKLGGYDWTFVIDGDGAVLQQYVVTGIPTHIFIDKQGVIQNISVGGISGDMMDESLAKILGN